MHKFTLPAGTTNRHKWHKDAAKAVQGVTDTFNMMRQKWGTVGQDEEESLVTVFGFGCDQYKNPEAVKVYEQLGERFGWSITRENAAEIAEAFTEARATCMQTVPVEDNRKTPEERAEQEETRKTQDAERKAAKDEKAERVEVLAAELRKKYPNAIGPESGKSSHARASANFKQILQAMGLRCSVKSSSFSMGDSVTAHVLTPDLPPEQREELEEIAELFNYSTFDPMTDSSGYDHSDAGEAWEAVNGRAKYCRIEFEQSDENRAACVDFCGDDGSHYQIWTGVHPDAAEFWTEWARQHEPPKPAEPVTQGGAYRVEKHHHTKRGFDFWLVIPAERVERDEFTRLRDSCKAAGGWYSRKWGKTPGGFAFKEQERAGAWGIQEFGGDRTPPDDGARPHPDTLREKAQGEIRQAFEAQRGTSKKRTAKAEKFRDMADKLAGEVEAKRAPHQENTPKRQREAMSRRMDADRLERTEQALRALADLHEAGEVPEVLAKFTSKKAVYEALGVRTVSQGYYHVAPTDEHTDESPEAAALWSLLDGKSPEQEKADRLAELRAGVRGSKIPGYFPTPAELAADMVDRLDIRRGSGAAESWSLLEPSAGCGSILDEVEQLAAEPLTVVYELNPTLCEILQAKGYDARPVDFLEQKPGQFRYDAVLMNPPFEKMQDVDHVRHAFDFLKPGGRLVAIMSPGPFFRDTAKAREFRDWLEELGGEVEDIEAGAFKESGTGVASKLVVIDKPENCDTCGARPGEIHPRACADHIEAEQFKRDAGVPPQGGQMLLI
jgi:hypothetical protein